MESRSIDDLGYSGPNSPEFLESIKVELNVNEKNENLFDLNTQGSVPRVLIGLKSGKLLASKLTESEGIDMGLEEAFLSPNLQVWGTPLNSKLLITGSLGIDPKLVEIKSNYPRFKMLVKENENEEDILERKRNKRRRLEDIFGKEFETDTDKMLTSLEGEKRHTK